MAGSHVHALYRHGDSRIHGLPPHVKIVAAFGYVFAVVATPREALWAFAVYFAILLAAATLARLGIRFVALRMVIEIPFVVVALLLPFFGGGETVEVLGVALSREGLWDMWNIVAKATAGLLTSIVLAGTTQITELLRGMDALRVPRVITSIMMFMIRYLDVVFGELSRTRVAMRSRGYRPRWLGHIRPFAQSIGHLFIRSYERGERVYLAMASRGYTGTMPPVAGDAATARQWAGVLSVPAAAWVIAVLALTS